MLCRLNPVIDSFFNPHIDLKLNINNIHQPDWPPDIMDIAVPCRNPDTGYDSKMDLTRKFIVTHKLFPLATFILHRILPSTATQIMASGEPAAIGLRVPCTSIRRNEVLNVMASLTLFTVNMNTGKLNTCLTFASR